MSVSIALVYPDLLGTYGDSGNAAILAQRLRWRGHDAHVLTVSANDAVPAGCDLYVIGGGEDLPQDLAASKLNAGRALHRAVGDGAVVLAVCAGFQIVGERVVSPDGQPRQGLGLLDCVTVATKTPRAIGELLVEPSQKWQGHGLGVLTGFENHGAVTELGRGAQPVGEVKLGVGNKDGTLEGAVSGRIWATYMHGPVLARNPHLADLLLSWVVGPLRPLDDSEPDALHAERVARAFGERRGERPGRWARRS